MKKNANKKNTWIDEILSVMENKDIKDMTMGVSLDYKKQSIFKKIEYLIHLVNKQNIIIFCQIFFFLFRLPLFLKQKNVKFLKI